MGTLLKLPVEVRQMIYAECLVVGKVYPYFFSQQSGQPEGNLDPGGNDSTLQEETGQYLPETALLQVCKVTYQEAEPLLYQRNTFVLPTADYIVRLFTHSLYNEIRRRMIKSVECTFDSADLSPRDREEILDEKLKNDRDSMLFPERIGVDLWPNDFLDSLHVAYKHRLTFSTWPQMVSHLLDLELDDLTIDFSNVLCTSGCCYLRAMAVRELCKGFAKAMPRKIELQGLKLERTGQDYSSKVIKLVSHGTHKRLVLKKPFDLRQSTIGYLSSRFEKP
ncbi:hypothetical protein ACLMJK_009480 [Lecanora helva]